MIEKLRALIGKLLENSQIPGPYRPVIKGMIEKALTQMSEDQLRAYIIDMRDNLIPWLLGEK